MINLVKNVICPHCLEANKIDLQNSITDVSTYDRSMGEETEYSIELNDIKCNVCLKEFNVKGSIYEYPEGCENYDTIKGYVTDEDLQIKKNTMDDKEKIDFC